MRPLTRSTKLLLLGVLFVASALAVVIAFYDPNSAIAIYYDKHERLASLPSPKVVLIGGSNLTYGMNSAKLEENLKIPVVNTAYSAGLGLRFELDDILPGIKKGDSVVISPAYEQFYPSLFNGTGDILNILFYHPSSITAITSWKQVLGIAEYVPSFLQTNLKKHLISPALHELLRREGNPGVIYTKEDFNAQGDLIGYLQHAPHSTITAKAFPDEEIDPEAIEALNRFLEKATERGARVIFLFPPLSQSAYTINRSAIQEIEQALRTQTRLEIPAHPEEFVFPDDQFFDNVYHLYKEGTIKRTELFRRYLSGF